MSNTNYIGFARGVSTNFSPAAADSNTLYFLTDTNQFFLGGEEYSKGVEELASAPTANLVGIEGKLYIYNNILYTYLNNNWTITGFTNWTMLNGFPEDSEFHFLAYQDQDPDVSPAVMIPLSAIKTNLGTSGSGDIADGSITTIKIADGAVTQEKLAENSVSSTQIVGYTIGHLEISKDAIYTDALQKNVVTPEKLDRQYLERRRLWTTITTWTDLFNTVILSTDTQHPATLQFMLSCEAPLPTAYEGTGLTIQRGICWATSANTIFIHSMNNMNCVWRISKKTSSTSSKLNYEKSEIVDGVTHYYIIELMQTPSEGIANGSITPEKFDREYCAWVGDLHTNAHFQNAFKPYIETDTIVYFNASAEIFSRLGGNAVSSGNDKYYNCIGKYIGMKTTAISSSLTYYYYEFDIYIPDKAEHYKVYFTATSNQGANSNFIDLTFSKQTYQIKDEKGYYSSLDVDGALEEIAEHSINYESGDINVTDLYASYEGHSGITMTGTYNLIGDYCYINVKAKTINGWGEMYFPLPVAVKEIRTDVISAISTVGNTSSTNTKLSAIQVAIGAGYHPNWNQSSSDSSYDTMANKGVLILVGVDGNFDGTTLQFDFYYKYK